MFKDLEVCDGAYEVLTEIFANAGTREIDYDEGYKMMLDMIEDLGLDMGTQTQMTKRHTYFSMVD